MKWRVKILLMCLACTMTALLLQALLVQNVSSRLLEGRIREETALSLQNLQNSVYSYLSAMESKLLKIYENEAFLTRLSHDATVEALREEFPSLARDLTASAFETTDGVRSVYLYTDDHQVISAYRRYTTPKHNYPTDIHADEQYNGAAVRAYIDSDATGLFLSSYYNTHRQKNIVRLVLKLFAGYRYDRPVGYVVCDVDSDTLTALMKKCIPDPELFVWLQPEGDRPAVSIGVPDPEQQDRYSSLSAAIAAGTGVQDRDLLRSDQSRYNLTAWTLVPQELIRQNQQALSMSLTAIAAVMLLVAVVLTALVVRSMTRPLERMMATIDRIKEGRTELRVEDRRTDELGLLGRSVNEMLDNLEALRIREQEHIRLLEQAEYRALQAQINPHFLYNTLETMAAIAELEDCPQVSRLSDSLSRTFRYCLNTRDAFSTVGKELDHLRNYTYIMDVRLHGDVRFRYDIDEAILDEPIPRLTLQPLVENALNHGLKNKSGEKQVAITGRALGNRMVLTVEDTGLGMDAEAMNASLAADALRCAAQGSSIGLHNIHARLRLLHGAEGGLWVDSRAGEFTRITITIPRRTEDSL